MFIQPFFPLLASHVRKPETNLRDVIDALCNVAGTGGGWRMLSNEYPPWQTVYWWFRPLVRRVLFQTIHHVTQMFDSEHQGRAQSPTAGVINRQSIKAAAAQYYGFDAGEKVVGRKRHIAVDTDGRLLIRGMRNNPLHDSSA